MGYLGRFTSPKKFTSCNHSDVRAFLHKQYAKFDREVRHDLKVAALQAAVGLGGVAARAVGLRRHRGRMNKSRFRDHDPSRDPRAYSPIMTPRTLLGPTAGQAARERDDVAVLSQRELIVDPGAAMKRVSEQKRDFGFLTATSESPPDTRAERLSGERRHIRRQKSEDLLGRQTRGAK